MDLFVGSILAIKTHLLWFYFPIWTPDVGKKLLLGLGCRAIINVKSYFTTQKYKVSYNGDWTSVSIDVTLSIWQTQPIQMLHLYIR